MSFEVQTSQKHKDFVREPMKDKPIDAIAGIGAIVGYKLVAKGYEKAYQLFGQYLLMQFSDCKESDDMFVAYLQSEFTFTSKHAEDVLRCLKEWKDTHL